MSDDLIDMVCRALGRAWGLGQTYWQQADSESYSQNRKSEETQRKFDALLEETRSALSQPAPQGVAEVMELVDLLLHEQLSRMAASEYLGGGHYDKVKQAITALVQERDAKKARVTALGIVAVERAFEIETLKSRMAELEGDVARDAARYKLLRNCPITVTDGLIDVCLWSDDSGDALRGDALDVVVDAAIAAIKDPSHD